MGIDINQPLPQHIIDIIKQRNALRNSNHLDPNIKTLNDKVTKLISEHKTEIWKTKLEQIGTHNKKLSHSMENYQQTQEQKPSGSCKHKHQI